MGPQRAPPWDSKKRMLWASSMATSGLLRHSHSLMAPPEVWDAQSLPASLPHLPNQPITHSTHHGDEWGLKGPRLGTLKSGCCGPAAWRRAVFYGTLTVSWHHLRCGMPQSLPASLPHLSNQPITHSTHHGDEWGPQRAPPWDSKKRMLWASSMATSGPSTALSQSHGTT